MSNGTAAESTNSFADMAESNSKQLSANIESLGAAIDEYREKDTPDSKAIVEKLQSLAAQGAALAMTMAECMNLVSKGQSNLSVREMQAIRQTFTKVEEWNCLVSDMFE